MFTLPPTAASPAFARNLVVILINKPTEQAGVFPAVVDAKRPFGEMCAPNFNLVILSEASAFCERSEESLVQPCAQTNMLYSKMDTNYL
jgi:hypothetical protein